MKITITTGVYPPDIGGPAEYARQLFNTLLIQDHKVNVVNFGDLRKNISGLRHFLYFFRLASQAYDTEYIIALDTFSTGLPTVIFSILFRKKVVVRVGGDFLWESYVNRTRENIFLSDFYKNILKYSLKERIIFILTRFVFKYADYIAFNTEWQRKIMTEPYGLVFKKTCIIENAYLDVESSRVDYSQKIFLSPTRESYVKNKQKLEEAFGIVSKKHNDIVLDTKIVSHLVMVEKISKAYAVLATSLSDVSPNLVLYALQYAVPVIITKDTGMADRLKSMAIFVDPLSVNDIVSAIEDILDPVKYQEYRDNIINSKYRHSWNEIAQEFLDLYKKI